jgi:Protein of unknown function (DUF3429)
MMTEDHRRTMTFALIAAGLLPFLAAAAMTLFTGGSYRGWIAEEVATVYGAVILSFLGGIRWGAALERGPAATLAVSVVPSLIGFISLWMEPVTALITLIAGFLIQFGWDAMSGDALPEWFLRQRMGVTIAAASSMIVVLYGAL